MKLPRNGSALANCVLVATGAVLGAGVSWMGHGLSDPQPASKNDTVLIGQGIEPRASVDFPAASSDNPRALVTSARIEVDPSARSNLMTVAGKAAAKKDLSDALLLAAELDSQQDRLDFHRGLFGVWADRDPVAALEHAQNNFEAGSLQSEAIGLVINKWGAEHPHEAWVWSEQHLSGPLRERAQTDLMIGWTRRTPDLASKWLADSGRTSQPLVNAVARTWAEQAPLDAANWARSLPAGPVRLTAEVAVAGEWAARDPQQAVDHFASEVVKGESLPLAIALTDVWATADPAATAEWISRLPAGANREHAAAALATVWGASDIDAAVAWSETVSDSSMRRQVIAHLGTTWGAIEPVQAISWLTSLPHADATDGLTGAFYSWAGTAPRDLREWIEHAPDPGLSDQARLSLGDVLTASDAAVSMELALGMSATRRADALARFFREWRKRDDPSAQDWIDANWGSLPADARDRLAREQAREWRRR